MQFVLEFVPGVLMATVGFTFSGLVLNLILTFPVFVNITELIIMIPTLLALKGNLDMTLASRLSTAAHTGIFDDTKSAFKLIALNLAVLQVQAIVVGVFTAVFSQILASLSSQPFAVDHFIILIGASVGTASVSAATLSFITCLICMYSARYNFNPDNFATPIVSALGDVTSLLLMAAVASFLYALLQSGVGFFVYIIILVFCLSVPFWWKIGSQNDACKEVLKEGWVPLLLSMAIDSISGVVLQGAQANYQGLVVLVPNVNGTGGCLATVYASRLCSALHHGKEENHKRTIATLIAVVIPLQAAYLTLIKLAALDNTCVDAKFFFVYEVVVVLQGLLLMVSAYCTVKVVWRFGKDPDNWATPILTALGDVYGTCLLVGGYHILYQNQYLATCNPI